MPVHNSSRAVVLLLVGCASLLGCHDSTGPAPSGGLLNGDWYWEAFSTDSAAGVYCQNQSILSITQHDSAFHADGPVDGYCTTSDNDTNTSGQLNLVTGRLRGDTVRFTIDGCPYVGALYGSRPDSVSGTLDCPTVIRGVSAQVRGPWHLLHGPPDRTPPWLGDSLVSAVTMATGTAIIGDTLQLTIKAEDDRKLAWVGYSLVGGGAFRLTDSMPASGESYTARFSITVVEAMVGQMAVTVFATDSAGNRTARDPDTLTISPVTLLPVIRAELPGIVRNHVYDAKRDRIYLSMADLAMVAVVDRSTGQLLPSIQLPARPSGLDLSVSGDSLIVGLLDHPALAVVDLVTDVIDTVHIEFGPIPPEGGTGAVQVAGNGVALVVGNFGQLVSVNLATRGTTIRTDIGTYLGLVYELSSMARPPDGHEIALVQTGVCCSVPSYIYRTATDDFSGPIVDDSAGGPLASAAIGGRFIEGRMIFDQNLAFVRSMTDSSYRPGAGTAISADGTLAFLGGWNLGLSGFSANSIATGARTGWYFVPIFNVYTFRSRLAALADGQTLLIYDTIDSGQSPPYDSRELFIVQLPR